MPAIETQATLRRCFARWGKPQRIRVDNGTPWRSKGDLPTDLELWLAGLGVEVRANPPRRPQDNGVVERSQGTGKRWAEPHQAGSAEQLQATINEMDRRQRESYPYRGQASRLAAHPDLEHSGRAYDASREQEDWVLEWAQDLLAGFVVARQVDRAGMISVYNRNYYVGKSYVGKSIHVRYDPPQRLWLFQEEGGHLVNRHEAAEIDTANIRGQTVTHRRDRSGTTGVGKLGVGISVGQLDVG